ncbi:protein NYNRIN-like [Dicentrarchus labrax]|uniref:protein NYNRIN-like n=1 Tax=Dicentrarchus labrax TaxID=13489 RepID=UPI0021F66F62|nr:protein NYNRIN-like [Dicentrarchus labrax]
MQASATADEKRLWKTCGAVLKDDVWMGPDNKPSLPRKFFPHYAKLTHGKDHVSKGGMLNDITKFWFTKGFSSYAQKYCQACMVCATHNVGRPVAVTGQAAHTPPTRPFEHIMMDFIELTPSEGKSHCLVMVDMWSKWVEAFPASKQTASVVAKAILSEIIPRWGIPGRISSDNGTHFVNEAIKQISGYMGFDLRTHCAYHPASGGAVERENGTLKAKLAKCCEDTGLSWTRALPLVLMYMRMRRRARTNLSPFEVLFAAPPHVGTQPPDSPPPSTSLCEHDMITYCTNLSSALSSIRQQVTATLPRPAAFPLHSLQPGDYVVVKDFRRKNWQARRWQGPFQVLLTTHTAIKVAERATWIHASHCRRVPDPSTTTQTQ